MFMYLSGMLSFALFRKHLLVMLMSLEFLVLALYTGMFLFLGSFGQEFFFSLIFLTLSVCEGALSLAVLVLMIRNQGNDYFMTMNMLW
uniref:NADH-ubiquinone oxidoreductase chain 4L n=1 Tax=Stylosomus rugithorax TaxID=1425630 RepID=A0A3G1GQ57_9CUCU|nr:NADH dehydrogenase subunit 4L [Stylosomus rugithorax]